VSGTDSPAPKQTLPKPCQKLLRADGPSLSSTPMSEFLMPTNKSISQLVEEFRTGIIGVPEIQRDVVWKPDQVRDLIDSISRGFPCGSLILWEPRERDEHLVKSMVRPERLEAFRGHLPRYFLLDGQQRLTAIASAVLERVELKQILAEIEEDMPYLVVNLRRFPGGVEATDQAAHAFPWVLFNDLFDGSALKQGEVAGLSAEALAKVRTYVQRFRDYSFPVQIIRDRDYATVAEIFTRVNSEGTQLTGAEINLARIVPRWPGITREFRDYRRELQLRKYDLDLTFLMRALTVVECNVPQIRKLAEKVNKDRPSKRHLNQTWKKTRSATDRIVRTLQRELRLDKSRYVASKNALVPLVYYFANRVGKGRADRDAVRFFLLSQLSGHYGASSESALRKDFKLLSGLSPRAGLRELVEQVEGETRHEFRGLKVRPDQVYGVSSRNVLVLLLYLILRSHDATDWGPGPVMGIGELEPIETQLHHIFPPNFMVGNRAAFKWYDDNDYPRSTYQDDVNSIVNLTFISRSRNVTIGDRAPSEYLPNDTTARMRQVHLIPEDANLWKPENFGKFISQRQILMAKAMTSYLKAL
jgi:hypothetical protein